MGRKYKPKLGARRYRNYSEETLRKAVNAIKINGMSYKDAESLFNIPYRTLWNKVNERHTEKVGGQPLLSELEERHLVDVLLAASEFGSPVTSLDLRHIVKRYLDRCGKRIPKLPDNFPGHDWVLNFIDRNKAKLTQRSCQNIKTVRAEKSEDELKNYFQNLEQSLNGVPPENCLNYDETNLTDDPGSTKCIFRRGTKYPERLMNTTKAAISVMFAITADGEALAPYVVYKAERLYDQWTIGGPPGTRYNRTKSGWFDGCSFEDWFNTVAIPWAEKREGPKLIIGDNLSSHLNLAIVQSCQRHSIRFVFLPPNSTHLCQPLDVGYYGPLKKVWRKILTKYKMQNPREKAVNKCIFPTLLRKLVGELNLTNKKNIQSAFRACGIVPFNKDEVLKKLPKLQEDVAESVSDTLLDYLKELRSPSTTTQTRKKMVHIAPGKSVSAEDFQNPSVDHSETESVVENESLDENNENQELEDEEGVTEQPNPQVGDFVVVAFPTKKTVRHFIGKVLNITDNEYYIDFLRKKREGFIFPPVEDRSSIQDMDIVKTLPVPRIHRGYHYFDMADLAGYNLN